MDRFEKWAEYIMKHGDKIIEEKKHRNMLIRRVSFSCASAFAAVIVGFFAWKSAPPKIDMPSDIIISESTTIPNSTFTENTSPATTSNINTSYTSNTDISKTLTTTVSEATETVTSVVIETLTSSKTEQTTVEQEEQPATSTVTYSETKTASQVTTTAATTVTLSVRTSMVFDNPSKFPIIRLYHTASVSDSEYTVMKENEVVSIETDYNPLMSDWSGIGILLEFDSKDCPITLSTNEGHFTAWDKEKGSGIVTNVGKTYDIGNSGYIFWTPDDLSYSENFESEIIIVGDNNGMSVKLGKIIVNRNEKSTLSAVLKEVNTSF